MEVNIPKTRAILIAAHPDDEVLWAGGWILSHPDWEWHIYVLCRASDPDRAPKFYRVLQSIHAGGRMADLDDGPDQIPLDQNGVMETIVDMVSREGIDYDYCLTHGPDGEYTRHLRHEEVSRAVRSLWLNADLPSTNLWMFAYQDKNKEILPVTEPEADCRYSLPQGIWDEKYRLITEVYGFLPDSWEARTTPKQEAFWCFDNKKQLLQWLHR